MDKRKQQRRNKLQRSKNVPLFKLADPIIQSLLFILFIYTIDIPDIVSYQTAFYLLFSVQVASLAINFLLRFLDLLTTERMIYAVVVVVYMVIYFYMGGHVTEKLMRVNANTDDNAMPVYEIITRGVGILIAFWYFTICFREVRVLFKNEHGGDFE